MEKQKEIKAKELEEMKSNLNLNNRRDQITFSKSLAYDDRKLFEEDLDERDRSQSKKQEMVVMNKVMDDVENIQDIQNTMHELTDLMNNFTEKIIQQDEVVTTILADAEEANVNIKEAGKELKKAHEYQKGYDKVVAGLYIIMAVLLLIYDRITAVYY